VGRAITAAPDPAAAAAAVAAEVRSAQNISSGGIA
jgi:orotidine-5'-phosphate decarboxylase